MAKKRDIELLFEISSFRNFDRAWKRWLGPDTANHAEHSFRVALYALMIATREGIGNHERILKMALLHDLPENRCQDVDYIQRHYVTRNERLAAQDIFSDTSLYKEGMSALNEYWQHTTVESKIVKDADMLDVDVEFQEHISRGEVMHKKQIIKRKQGVYPKFFTQTAKQLWKQIYQTDPNCWHINSPRNRFNGGDWQPKKSN